MRRSLERLVPYRPTPHAGTILHNNVNRWGRNPVWDKLPELLDLVPNDYPDDGATELRDALADLYGLAPEQFLVANGSNEAFDLAFKALLDPGARVAFPSPSFSMYAKYAHINAVEPVEIALDDAFDLDASAMTDADADLHVLCSPNNPTGNPLSRDRVAAVLEGNRPVIVDEAYGEFTEPNWLDEIARRPNLLVSRTFSKAYGLAGLRLGYLVGNADLIQRVERARLPYNLNSVAQRVAAAALGEQGFVRDYVAYVTAERPRWSEALRGLGFRVWPSKTNFVLAQVPDERDRDALVAALGDRDVWIRSAGSHPRLSRCVRITIGSHDDRDALFGALEEVL